jgi:Antibiotic biosynthesis monooxygenase
MYMRIVRFQPPAGQADEMARKWEAFYSERMRAQPGFRHAHFGIDRATGATAVVTVLENKPDDALFERLLEEFRDTVGMTISGQAPEVTLYEIAAEF